jgi:hypothetical protein
MQPSRQPQIAMINHQAQTITIPERSPARPHHPPARSRRWPRAEDQKDHREQPRQVATHHLGRGWMTDLDRVVCEANCADRASCATGRWRGTNEPHASITSAPAVRLHQALVPRQVGPPFRLRVEGETFHAQTRDRRPGCVVGVEIKSLVRGVRFGLGEDIPGPVNPKSGHLRSCFWGLRRQRPRRCAGGGGLGQ